MRHQILECNYIFVVLQITTLTCDLQNYDRVYSKSHHAMSQYMANMTYLASQLKDRRINSTLIYDGEPTPPAILNIRDI